VLLTSCAVPPDAWPAPSPCTEWDARAVVEHVIGFLAYAAAVASTFARAEGMIRPEVALAPDAPVADKLVAFYGRDPAWSAA
jgi:hypothetical protein